jgi:hypothetical protein
MKSKIVAFLVGCLMTMGVGYGAILVGQIYPYVSIIKGLAGIALFAIWLVVILYFYL